MHLRAPAGEYTEKLRGMLWAHPVITVTQWGLGLLTGSQDWVPYCPGHSIGYQEAWHCVCEGERERKREREKDRASARARAWEGDCLCERECWITVLIALFEEFVLLACVSVTVCASVPLFVCVFGFIFVCFCVQLLPADVSLGPQNCMHHVRQRWLACTEIWKLFRFEIHWTSIKGTKLLFQIKKAIIIYKHCNTLQLTEIH